MQKHLQSYRPYGRREIHKKELVAKIATVILAAFVVFPLASCGGGKNLVAGSTYVMAESTFSKYKERVPYQRVFSFFADGTVLTYEHFGKSDKGPAYFVWTDGVEKHESDVAPTKANAKYTVLDFTPSEDQAKNDLWANLNKQIVVSGEGTFYINKDDPAMALGPMGIYHRQ